MFHSVSYAADFFNFLFFRLIALIRDEEENEELLTEAAILLGSMANGSRDLVDSLVDSGLVKVMLQGMLFLISNLLFFNCFCF